MSNNVYEMMTFNKKTLELEKMTLFKGNKSIEFTKEEAQDMVPDHIYRAQKDMFLLRAFEKGGVK